MMIMQATRETAEQAFITVKNGFATTLTTGNVCSYDLKGDSTGGTVTQPQTGTNSAWHAIAGVSGEDIPTGDRGKVAVYGVHETLFSTETTANADIEIGQVVGPITATFHLTSTGLSDGKMGGTFVTAERVISGTLGTAKCFIRFM